MGKCTIIYTLQYCLKIDKYIYSFILVYTLRNKYYQSLKKQKKVKKSRGKIDSITMVT